MYECWQGPQKKNPPIPPPISWGGGAKSISFLGSLGGGARGTFAPPLNQLGGGATDHSPPPTNFFDPPKTVGKGPKNNTHSSLSGFKSFLFLSKKYISKDVTNKDMTFFETILQKCINKTSRNKLYF